MEHQLEVKGIVRRETLTRQNPLVFDGSPSLYSFSTLHTPHKDLYERGDSTDPKPAFPCVTSGDGVMG